MARRRVGARARVRGAPPAGGEDRARVRGARAAIDSLAGLPELHVEPLGHRDARALLESVLPARLDERVLERIVAETRGNPLALLELPRGLTPGPARRRVRPAGGAAAVRRDRGELHAAAGAAPARRAAVAAPGGGRAGRRSGAAVARGAAARDPGDGRARRRVGRLADAGRRGGVPPSARALGGVRRGRAERAARGPPRAGGGDRSARSTRIAAPGTARRRRRCPTRTSPPSSSAPRPSAGARRLRRRGRLPRARRGADARGVAPGQARARRGADEVPGRRARRRARACVATAESGALDELERARVDLLRAQIAFVSTRGSDAAPLLLEAAERLEPLDPELARETYLEALSAAMFAGRLAGPGASSLEVARAARAAPPAPPATRGSSCLLDGLVTLFTEGYEAAVPILREAQRAFERRDVGDRAAALEVGRDRLGRAPLGRRALGALSERHVRLARETGALGDLPLALSHAGLDASLRGRAGGGGVSRR